jgi:hypothetical protein
MSQKANKLKKYVRPGLVVLVLAIFLVSIFSVISKPKVHAATFLLSGTTWTVPSDWVSSNNTIEVIGGGGGAGAAFQQSTGNGGEGGGGGGGGGYAKAINVTLTPGSTVAIAIGAGGSGGTGSGSNGSAGGDTYLCNDTANCTSLSDSSVVVGAQGGAGGTGGQTATVGAGGAGGAATSAVGAVKYNGGTGGNGGPFASSAGGGGGGGGGAAGLNAGGNNGVTPIADPHGNGGQGDGTSGGAGGTANSGSGSNGTEYDATHGSGGGGAGGDGSKNNAGSPGGNGGQYGAGGGGGGGNGRAASAAGNGGGGVQGMIRITYSLQTQADYRWRLDDGSETSGTSLASQDTAATINSNQTARLRLLVTNLGESTTNSYQLEYAPYDGGCYNWTAVPNSATTEHFNMASTSNYTDQAASTNVTSGPGVITDPPGYTFTAGKLVESPSNTASSVPVGSPNFTELEYAIQPNNNATFNAYCFRVTNAGTPLDNYANYPILNVNYVPSAPTIYSVANGTANVPLLPTFQLRSSDGNGDYLQYVIEECSANSWPCSSGAHTYDQTSSQTCWSLQDAQSGTAFLSSPTLSSSSMAYCQMPTSDILSSNTTYYMRAKAIDPGGSNTYSAYSSVVSFTTGTLHVQINGGTNITGGTKIGN